MLNRTNIQACSLASVLAACNANWIDGRDTENNQPETGARLSIDYDLETDVVGFHFEVERVECFTGEEFARFFYEENVALDDLLFPGQIDFLGFDPFSPYSNHEGADFFVALDAGCYVVTAYPASEIAEDEWTASEECSIAESDVLEVVDGYTTETVLMSQCDGELVGALDALVVMNKPPIVIPDIDNKFNSQCETVEICATAWDPNDDPMEIVFERLSGPEFFSLDVGDMELVGYEDGHKVYEQCAWIVTEDIADYIVEIRAYDLVYDEHGAEVRIEDVIGQDSHGWIQVPIHTGWNISDTCYSGDETLATTSGHACTCDECDCLDCGDGSCDCDECDCPEMCMVISDEEFLCSGDYDVDPELVELVCDGTDLLEEVLYPECD